MSIILLTHYLPIDNSSRISAAQLSNLNEIIGKNITIKAISKNRFLTTENSSSKANVMANLITPIASSYFTIKLNKTDKKINYYTIQDQQGRYLSCSISGNTYSLSMKSTSSATKSELFLIDQNSGSVNSFSFKQAVTDDSNNFYYVSNSRNHNNNTLEIQRTASPTDYEKFSMETLPSNNVTKYGTNLSILEITDSGVSDLASLKEANGILASKVKTVSMKSFVADRSALDGVYDIIYIGSGKYNVSLPKDYINAISTGVANADMNTTKIQNDITMLKANEIISEYINKDQLVILHEDILNQVTQNGIANLKTMFAKYNSSDKRSNVVFVNNDHLASAYAFDQRTKLSTKGNIRTTFTLTSQPIEYTENTTKIYSAGETISFSIKIDPAKYNSSKTLALRLYLQDDSTLGYDAEHIVAEASINQSTATISYKLTSGYSGLRYWRLELIDPTTKLKDIEEGSIRFRDQKLNIRVLQVMPNGDTASNLNNKIAASYLDTPDYKITIKAIPIDSNDSKVETFNNSAYKDLNSKYDMLIFGFRDEYNKEAYLRSDRESNKALDAFIKTGQGVMFTHDTMFNPNNDIWVREFIDVVGQIRPYHNFGFGGPIQTEEVDLVNSGLLTQFPLNIEQAQYSAMRVATTHSQYYTLDLEDEEVVNWYNLKANSLTPGDSWNNYYTYSKGNITYSGTGHTYGTGGSDFPDWEKQVFVNTIYRGFTGANHAPVLDVITPVNYSSSTNNYIASYEPTINVRYTATDYDLTDTNLTTNVTIKYKDANDVQVTKTIIKKLAIISGETVQYELANPLQNLPTGSRDITFEFEVTDSSGAKTQQTVVVKIQKVNANVELARTATSTDFIASNTIKKNNSVTLTYTVTPQPIVVSSGSVAPSIKNVAFEEVFPSNVNVIVTPATGTHNLTSKTTAGVTTVSGNIKDGTITYTKGTTANNTTTYTAAPITFTIKITPTKNGLYTFDKGILKFSDYLSNGNYSSIISLPFPSYTLEAVTLVSSISVADKQILVGDEAKLIPSLEAAVTPADATNKNVKYESLDPTIVTVSATGVITGMKAGVGRVKVTALDGSNISATARITVVQPGLSITGPTQVEIGNIITLGYDLTNINYELISSTWSATANSSSGGKALVQVGPPTTNSTVSIKGLTIGTATIQLNLTIKDTITGNIKSLPPAILQVEVIAPKLSKLWLPEIIELELPAGSGSSVTRDLLTDLITFPSSAKSYITSQLIWTVTSSNNVGTINQSSGLFTANKVGYEKVKVTYKNDATMYAEVTIKVKSSTTTTPDDGSPGGGSNTIGGKY